MPERPRAPGEEELLRERNRALAEQVKRFVKSEQRLSMSQRALARQIRRFDALNAWMVEAVTQPESVAIFESAMRLLLSSFPYEQGLGLLADSNGELVAVATTSVPGCEGKSREGLAGLQRRRPAAVRLPPEPATGSVADICARGDDSCQAIHLLLEVFGADDTSGGMALVLPLPGPRPEHRSAIVLRRGEGPISFHDRLPQADDRPFLELIGQQVAVALTNAHLVTSLKQSYADLAQAQSELVIRERLAVLGQLAAVVAHEVRNPLGAIINSLSTLDRIAEPKNEVAPLLGIVREEADRVNHIVTDLIDFARPGVIAKKEQDLGPIVEEAVLRATANARTRNVQIQLDSDDSRALVDEHLLRQALINLIENAIDASEHGGTVEVRAHCSGGAAQVEVKNLGQHIRESELDSIFEPFFTTKASGTGLGLAMVKRFADAHDGEVVVSSTRDAGTVFAVRWDVQV